MSEKKSHNISNARLKAIYKLLNDIGISKKEKNLIKANEALYIPIIHESLTHTSANLSQNHEKLEFLGDAVLRLAASEYIEEFFSELTVGDRSALRSQIVSDEWLAKLGQKIEINEIMLIGSKAEKDRAALETICAEGTEALIGAIYKCFKDLKIIKTWLSTEWDITSKDVLNDPYKLNSKSALQEWSQGKRLDKPVYEIQEVSKQHGDKKRFLCKVFVNKNMLGQAFGSSIKNSEKEAARIALDTIQKIKQFEDS